MEFESEALNGTLKLGESSDETDGFRPAGGKFSSIGERWDVLNVDLAGEFPKPSKPRPWAAAVAF